MQKISYKIFNLFVLLLFFAYGCGKKTEPIPKSSFNIKPPSKESLKLMDNGFKIINNSKNFILEVYKKTDDSCSTYKLVTKIEPKKSFVDTHVVSGQHVIYKLVRKHPEYRVYSTPIYIDTIFAKKAYVKIDNIIKKRDHFEIKLSLSKNTKFVLYGFDKNKLNNIVTKPIIKFKADKPVNVFILPYNNYNMKGKMVTLQLSYKYFQKVLPVKDIKVIKNHGKFLITWDNDVFKTKVVDKKTGKIITVTYANFVVVSKCTKILLIATNGVVDAKPIEINPCE